MRLGSYELARQIGAGGMGEVWVAHRVAPTRTLEAVAIKRLPRRLAGDPNYRRILLDEARLSQLLRHPNIVHTIEAGDADGEVFIVMELIDGLDLSRVTKLLSMQGERLPIPVSAYIAAEVLRGLAYAHELQHDGERISLVHRDVSPHNVMLSSSGTIKLTDFGVARLSSEDTSGTHVKGKARYMPPEQLRGDSRSPTVDLFAAGAVFQELLDGDTFRGDAIDDARLLGMAIDGVVPPLQHPDEVPRELALVRIGLLEPDARLRLRSAKHALQLLLRWPGYRPCPNEVAALIQRLRQQEFELSSGVSRTQTGLGNQATFLRTNEFEIDRSDLVDVVEAPDQILLDLAAHSNESSTRIPVQSARDEPSPEEARAPPPRDPSLALDLSGQSFARHVPTSPNPVVPQRRLIWPISLALVAVVVGGLALAYQRGWIPRTEDPTPIPPTTMRQARVAGRGSLLDLGLRDRGIDRLLVNDDIHFDYSPDPTIDPLAALARDEVEFALTSLDEFVRAKSPGRIVAIIGIPLASEALLLDTADHAKLRSLAELPINASIAHAPGTGALARTLADTLGLAGTPTELRDDAAVFAELERDDSELVAGIVREPWIGKAQAAGMTIATTRLDVPLADVEVLVVSERTLASDPTLVEAVVAAYYAQPPSPTALTERAATAYGLTQAEAERALAGLCWFDAPGAVAWLDSDAGKSLGKAVEPRFLLAQNSGRGTLESCWAAAPGKTGRPQELGTLALPNGDASWFEPGSASLVEQAIVSELAARLRPFNPSTITAEVIGFGDGSASSGRKLGRARAEAIVAALQAAGASLVMTASGKAHADAPASRLEIRLLRQP
jgi:serine/threonine protein kinase/outer membrane protein OmpA-like peptidoglycan-associated protein